jgi:hypothetical protein
MVDILDMLDIVEAQVETCKLPESFETFDVRYQIVIEVELL